MDEDFLHYIWQNRLLNSNQLETVCGKKLEIIDFGEKNFDQGPDFFNVKIKLDGQLWIGTVEIHIKSSDWYKHQHHKDKKYNNVILHVVKKYDQRVFNSEGYQIPTLVMSFDQAIYQRYVELRLSNHIIPCGKYLQLSDKQFEKEWFQEIIKQRLEQKSQEIFTELKKTNNNWQEVYYIFLAKNFGFKKNSLAFQMLARSLPYRYLQLHSNNLLQIEALLFGQAGMLNKDCKHSYYLSLRNEYQFLRTKYNLSPLDSSIWNFLRLRPANFPTIKIAQFSALINKGTLSFSVFYMLENISEISNFFDVNVSDYWIKHYDFCKPAKSPKNKHISRKSVENILINTVANFLYAYGMYTNEPSITQRAMALLKSLPPENNSIVNRWKKQNIKPQNAMETQALIHIFNNYCKANLCLECKVWNKIILKNI